MGQSSIDSVKDDITATDLKKEFDHLNTKLDSLVNSIKSLKLKPSNEASLTPLQTPLKSIDCEQLDDKVDWKTINNIADLTQQIPSIRFYPGDAASKIPSILRCETCYRLLKHRSSGEMSSASFLHKPLQSTGFPPHFFITA